MRNGDEIYKDFSKVLITRDRIRERVAEMGRELTRDYAGKLPVVISVLRGSVIFFSDLIREMDVHMITDFMAVSSYGNSDKSSGQVVITKDTKIPLEGMDVLVVEDIIDTGLTLKALMNILAGRGVSSLRLAVLLDKPARREVHDLKPDYTGFEVPDEFLVGYGLDYCGYYRNAPDIAVLRPEVAKEIEAEITKHAEETAEQIVRTAVRQAIEG